MATSRVMVGIILHVLLNSIHIIIHYRCYSCAMEIAMNQPTNKYISFIKFRIGLLKHFGITPILVFDGKRAALKVILQHP